MSVPSIISIHDLKFSYEQSTTAQNDLILSIKEWEVFPQQHVFLYGPSGSGKSTLLNVITGMADVKAGSVSILGQDIYALSNKHRDQFRAQHIGFVFQQLNLVPYLSVRDNIELAVYFKGDSQPPVPIETLVEQLQLPLSILDKQASTLSVGQQQRVAIARALINRPALIIADEPTSALDQNSRDAFIKVLFDAVQAQQSTLVFVSHDSTLSSHFGHVVDLESINRISNSARSHQNDVW